MNISISRLILLIIGLVLVIFGAKFLLDAVPAKDWVLGIFALVAMAAGFALVSGKGIHVSE